MAMRYAATAFVMSCLVTTVAAQQNPNILVPISVPSAIDGAYGSSWQTEVWVHNGTSSPL